MTFRYTIIGTSQALQSVLAQADKMAASAARVLIAGETGTGKELIAYYLHDRAPRREKPFVAINCSALPAGLLESELFGHVKGAFTEAHRTHEGLVAAAHGGTLFLDEIADMALPLQAKLLRFLETGEYRKVGSAQGETAYVRVISATHRNLSALVAQGLFREDLYYRLSVLTLDMPPLRARKDDIPLLAGHFLARFSAEENKDFTSFAPEALVRLAQYPWPGNVRELQNTLQKIAVLQNGMAVTEEMVEAVLPQTADAAAANVIALGAAPRPLWQVEEEAIAVAIRYCRGNIPRAAALLQVSPSTLYRRRGDNADISSS
jgi:two-component system repressor protein LuxO